MTEAAYMATLEAALAAYDDIQAIPRHVLVVCDPSTARLFADARRARLDTVRNDAPPRMFAPCGCVTLSRRRRIVRVLRDTAGTPRTDALRRPRADVDVYALDGETGVDQGYLSHIGVWWGVSDV